MNYLFKKNSDIIQMCSVVTHDRVLNGEHYAQRFQKLIYLHLFADLFHEDFTSNIRTNTVFVPTNEEKSS